MKIYNKKGLAWGIFWLVLGVSALVADLAINPSDFLPQTIKDVIIDMIIVLMGLAGFLRAFSAKATREDIIEENDERNKLVKLHNLSLKQTSKPHIGDTSLPIRREIALPNLKASLSHQHVQRTRVFVQLNA